ncbi:MAG: hypothetical protein K8S25_12725 [Alphaproteobacteria bacterium]|nr:hypothetical protein [Alphaproteobacteria bacterium]
MSYFRSAFRQIALTLIALALAGVRQAAAAETLTALNQCPMRGDNRACLIVSVLPASEDTSCDYYVGPYPPQKFFRVSGSLNEGPVREYRLKIKNPDQSSSPPPQAYLGQSSSGRAIVLTDQGPLEILDKSFAAPASEMYVVDKKRWKIETHLLASLSHPVVTASNDIGIWDDERQLCISAPIEPGRRLRVIEGGCMARPKEPTDQDRALQIRVRAQNGIRDTARAFAEWYASKSPGYAPSPPPESTDWVDAPAPNEFDWLGNVEREYVTLKQVRRLLPRDVNPEMGSDEQVAGHFGGMGTGIRVLRIKGSQTLIVNVSRDGGC